MLRTRIIPVLLLHDECLVKTKQFGKFTYVGDPCNTVRIFNELRVDELMFLDISATKQGKAPNLKIISEIANECFMPIGYGGAVTNVKDAADIFKIGVEKIVINSAALRNPSIISQIADQFGSQSLVVSIDVKSDLFGNNFVYDSAHRKKTRLRPEIWAKEVELLGAGEILLTSVDCENTWRGFDLRLMSSVASAVNIPVIANGGAGSLMHIRQCIKNTPVSAIALGSMVVFQKKGMGVLINFPDEESIIQALA